MPKLRISLEKLSSRHFVDGFREMRSSRFGASAAWTLYRLGEQIDKELQRFYRVRGEIEERFMVSQLYGVSK